MNLLSRRRHRRSPPGTAPGTVTTDPYAQKPQISVLSYGPEADPATIRVQPIASIEDLPELPPGHTIRWVNVAGLGDAEVLRAIGDRFGIHPLALEDISNTFQRPKVEPYGNSIFIVTRVPPPDALPAPPAGNGGPAASTTMRESQLITEQLSICLGRDFLLTFQEHTSELFEPVRRRLMAGAAGVEVQGPDYLAYSILDTALDAYFPLLETYGEEVEDLEASVVADPAINQIARIHNLKRNLLTTRRAVWPQREMLSALIRDETPLISAHTRIFLRDCYDHTIQLIDMIETYREISTGLVDIVLSSQSNRMNEIMKVLTIIATIFIPLSFIAGVYGMNFDTASPWNLPELKWRYGYPAVLGFMLFIALSLILWFRSKGWIGRPRS